MNLHPLLVLPIKTRTFMADYLPATFMGQIFPEVGFSKSPFGFGIGATHNHIEQENCLQTRPAPP